MPDNLVQTAHHHTVSAFDQELTSIIGKILKMGEHVDEMLNLSRKALDNPSDEILETVRATDKKVNALDFELQTDATKIIALRQPMGVDLRFVISTLKIASSMERMGDLVKSTCKKSGKFHSHVSQEIRRDLREMNALTSRMLNATMNAFRDLSAEKANEVLEQDNEVDTLYHKLLNSVQVHIKEHPEAIPAFADIIFTAKNYERMGDHSTKVADLVHYIASGQMMKKKKKAEPLKKDKTEN
mgnify:CR=1 FL=1